MSMGWAAMRDNTPFNDPMRVYYEHQRLFERNREQRALERQAEYATYTDSSPLDSYVENEELQRVDPKAHEFLVLRKEKFKELTEAEAKKLGKNSCEHARHLKLEKMYFGSGMVCGAVLLASLPIGILTAPLVLAANVSVFQRSYYENEAETDERTLQAASIEELKGGKRFYQACQKVEEIKKGNRGFFGNFFSKITDNELFFQCPSWDDRISKIKSNLEDRGEESVYTEEDKEKIELLTKLV